MLYTFVLSVVFKVRLDPQHHEIKDDTLTSYFIFTGLMLILIFNFLVFITEQVRAMILYEQLSHWSNIARYYLLEIFVAWTGLIGPNKTRQGFADVL